MRITGIEGEREKDGERKGRPGLTKRGEVLQTEREKDVYWRDEKEELTGT